IHPSLPGERGVLGEREVLSPLIPVRKCKEALRRHASREHFARNRVK
ncbi:hypothetical protein LCGC14_3025520, partial [marine sediment metagenome]